MSLWDRVAQFLALEPLQQRTAFLDAPDMSTQIAAVRRTQQATRPWRLPSIIEALGVPAISRAVTLISNTTGSLAMQAFRDGATMPDVPRVVSRPDPYQTPREFYRDSAYCLATRGEYVWWIASRDTDGTPSALVVVPLAELSVEENPRNRLFPVYRWGTVKSTRYSGANPTGDFVHQTYLREPGQLRGMGPLQLGMAAASVSVEAQEWAANFYADGGNGGTILRSSITVSDEEAALLRNDWVSIPNNVPRVIDPRIEDVKQNPVDPQGAQMLAARDWQNGEAARMFGMPGALVEYSAPGSSLTYQNVESIWRQFQAGCLTPNYLEPIEQGMSDLLSRSTVGRFNLKGLLRADILTRYQVHKIAIDAGIYGPEVAQQEEGYQPGDVEFAPVPFAPPAAVPATIPQTRSDPEFRCTGMRTIRRSGVTRLAQCSRLLAHATTFVGQCPRCKKTYEAA